MYTNYVFRHKTTHDGDCAMYIPSSIFAQVCSLQFDLYVEYSCTIKSVVLKQRVIIMICPSILITAINLYLGSCSIFNYTSLNIIRFFV
jgi:hypothetical protein